MSLILLPYIEIDIPFELDEFKNYPDYDETTFYTDLIIEMLKSLFFWYSQIIYDLIRTYWILSMLMFAVSFLLLYLLNKSKIKRFTIILIESIFLIFSIFFLIIPFNIGNEINLLKELGFKIIKSINEDKKETSKIPLELKELYPKYIGVEELKLIETNFEYKVYLSSNFRKGNDSLSQNLYEDDFEIHIRPDFMKPEYFYFNRNENRFVLTD